MKDRRSIEAIDVAERFALGTATTKELEVAHRAADDASPESMGFSHLPEAAAECATDPAACWAAIHAAYMAGTTLIMRRAGGSIDAAERQIKTEQRNAFIRICLDGWGA